MEGLGSHPERGARSFFGTLDAVLAHPARRCFSNTTFQRQASGPSGPVVRRGDFRSSAENLKKVRGRVDFAVETARRARASAPVRLSAGSPAGRRAAPKYLDVLPSHGAHAEGPTWQGRQRIAPDRARQGVRTVLVAGPVAPTFASASLRIVRGKAFARCSSLAPSHPRRLTYLLSGN